MRQGRRFLKWATRSELHSSKTRRSAFALSPYHRRLRCEPLEERRLLTVISSDTTWTASKVLTDNVYVESGATLTIQSGVQVQGSYALYIADDGTHAGLSASGVTFSDKVYLDFNATVSLSGNQFNGGVDVAAQLVSTLVGNTFSNSTMDIQSGVITTAVTFPKISGLTNYSLDYAPVTINGATVHGLHIRNGGSLTISDGDTISGTYGSGGSGYNLYVDDDGSGGTLKDDGTGGVIFTNGVYIYNGATVSLNGDTFVAAGQNGNFYFIGVDIAAQLATSLANDTFQGSNATMDIRSGVITTAVTFPKISGLTNYSLDVAAVTVNGASVSGLHIRNGGSLTIDNGDTISGTWGSGGSGYNLYVDDDGSGGTLKDDGTGGVIFTNGVYIYNGATVSLNGDTFVAAGQNGNFYFIGVDIAAQLATSLANDSFQGSNATMDIRSGVITTAVTFPKISGLTNYSLDVAAVTVNGASVSGLHIRNGGSLTIDNGDTISGTWGSGGSGYNLYVDDDGSGGTLKDDGTGGVIFTNGVYIYNGATVSLNGDTFVAAGQNGKFYFIGVDIAAQLATSLAGDVFQGSNATMDIQSGVITTAVTFPKIIGLSTYSVDASSGLNVRGGGSLTIACGNIISGYPLDISDDGSGGTLNAEDVTFSDQLTLGPTSGGLLEFDAFNYNGYDNFDGQMQATVKDDSFLASNAHAQGSVGPTINLANNYWGPGMTDSLIRQEKIYDYYTNNNQGVPVINFDPFLTTAPVFAEHLEFTAPPNDTAAGAIISPAVQISVKDPNGNLVLSDNSSVAVAIGTNAGGGALGGTPTMPAINGVATFNNLWIDKAGSGYTLTATDGSLAGITSGVFNVIAPPTITNVLVSSTTWNSTFLNYLASLSSQNVGGYSIPVGSGSQLVTLSWAGINQIKVVFSENVTVGQSDLLLSGVNTTAYNISGGTFSYNSATFTATWTLPQAISPDKLMLALNADGSDPIEDSVGNRLDGEWTNPTSTTQPTSSTYPSGDGTAGGNFDFRLNVLPGDASQDSTVNFTDLSKLLAHYGTTSGASWSQGDFNSDGAVNFSDLSILLASYGKSLPSGEPPVGSFPAAASLAPVVVPTAVSSKSTISVAPVTTVDTPATASGSQAAIASVSRSVAISQPAYLVSEPQPTAPPSLSAQVSMGQAPVMAIASPTIPPSTPRTLNDVRPVVGEPIACWAGAGSTSATVQKLRPVPFVIGARPGSYLGAAGNIIGPVADAAGDGWSVASAPRVDEELAAASTNGQRHAIVSQALDQVDLPTVVQHELGHVAGLGDLDSSVSDPMSSTLSEGVGRQVSVGDVDVVFTGYDGQNL
jgi:hypothetical protein